MNISKEIDHFQMERNKLSCYIDDEETVKNSHYSGWSFFF